jgi:voltage-gated potassium channel Kch
MTRRAALGRLAGLGVGVAAGAVYGGCSTNDDRERRALLDDLDIGFDAQPEVLGHRIRDGARVEPPPDAWRTVGVVIVGAGVAGLSAARALRARGFSDFVVLELESDAGGTARGGRTPVSAHPWGAHYTNLPQAGNADYVAFLRAHGAIEGFDAAGEPVPAEAFVCRDPDERSFYAGKWFEGLLPVSVMTTRATEELHRLERLAGEWAAFRDARGRAAFALPVEHGSDDAEIAALDRRTFAEWLDAHDLRSPPVRWLCDYACRDDFGAHPEQVSAFAGLHYFASRRRTPEAPGGGDTAPVLTWPEGNARLVDWLRADAAPELLTGLAVADVAPGGPEGGVEVRALDAATGGARGFRARQVLLAVPQGFAGRLLRPWRETPPAHLAEFVYGPWLVANLELHTRPGRRGFPLAWDNVPYGGSSLGYITATHQTGRDYGPTVLTWFEALADPDAGAARRALLSWDAAACRDRVLSDLAGAHPDLLRRLSRMRFVRHGHAMIRPRPGFVHGPHRRAAAQPYRDVYFAHTDLGGMALFEEAFFHGRRAAAEMLEARGWPA